MRNFTSRRTVLNKLLPHRQCNLNYCRYVYLALDDLTSHSMQHFGMRSPKSTIINNSQNETMQKTKRQTKQKWCLLVFNSLENRLQFWFTAALSVFLFSFFTFVLDVAVILSISRISFICEATRLAEVW